MSYSNSEFPPPSDEEIYRGYFLEDLSLVDRYKGPPSPTPDPNFLIDFFGVKTRSSTLGGGGGYVQDTPPFPSDSRLSEGVEFVSACLALEQTVGQKFTCVEVGAGWGPWTVLMATLASRRGFSEINAVAVEASPARFKLLQTHLFDNELLPSEDAIEGQNGPVRTKLFNAAGWWKDTTLFFPNEDDPSDAGMAATETQSESDYRGKALGHAEVPALSIANLCDPFNVVDFMHIDIQGGEWELVSKSKEFFDAKVRFLFLGTHSRKIEGDLIELLLNKGWKLFREKPCRFYGMADAPTLTGLTYYDGAQLWRNMNLV